MSNNKNSGDNSKEDIIQKGKYALIFMGGVAVGLGLKKVVDSPEFQNIKDNAAEMINDYFNPPVEYVNVDDNDIVADESVSQNQTE
ncbi:MAG: hypothetical protein ACI4VJ_05935 [Methanosphaera sp.]